MHFLENLCKTQVMTSFRLRPRFQIETNESMEQITERLHSKLIAAGHPFDEMIIPDHYILKIRKEDQHYWSPQLNLRFNKEGDNPLMISGRYEPHPNVWTLFMILYLSTGVLILFIGLIGFSQMSLGLSSPILWALPILILFGIFLYILTQLGQKLGAEQTFHLHHFLEEAINEKIHID